MGSLKTLHKKGAERFMQYVFLFSLAWRASRRMDSGLTVSGKPCHMHTHPHVHTHTHTYTHMHASTHACTHTHTHTHAHTPIYTHTHTHIHAHTHTHIHTHTHTHKIWQKSCNSKVLVGDVYLCVLVWVWVWVWVWRCAGASLCTIMLSLRYFPSMTFSNGSTQKRPVFPAKCLWFTNFCVWHFCISVHKWLFFIQSKASHILFLWIRKTLLTRV